MVGKVRDGVDPHQGKPVPYGAFSFFNSRQGAERRRSRPLQLFSFRLPGSKAETGKSPSYGNRFAWIGTFFMQTLTMSG